MRFIKRWVQLSFITLKYLIIAILRLVWIYPESYPKIIRQYLEESGGALIKVGQILALRYEILPPQYCWELSELFDNVKPMSMDQVREIVQSELNSPIEEKFALFEEQPIASASFAQVHKAILPNGKNVAVKIQRPDLNATVKNDFRFLKFISFFLSPFLNFKAIRINEALKEFEQTTLQELDYRLEKDNAEIIRKNLINPQKFYIPETYTDLTTAKILVQDFVYGQNLNDILRAIRGGSDFQHVSHLDINKIALDICQELGRQYLITGVYHCDPHPGNIIITPEGKISFVDFGIVGHARAYDRALFWDFIRPVVMDEESSKASEAFLRLGLRSIEEKVRFLAQNKEEPVKVYTQILKDLASTYEKTLESIILSWSNSIGNPAESLFNRSTAVAFLKAMRLAEQYHVHFQRDLILFVRTLVIADMMCMQLSPTFKIKEALQNLAWDHKEEINKLEELAQSAFEIRSEKLLDPWDEDVRDMTKEYLYDWFQSLVENRPALFEKLKTPIRKLEKLL